jgi:hypothetical protein
MLLVIVVNHFVLATCAQPSRSLILKLETGKYACECDDCESAKHGDDAHMFFSANRKKNMPNCSWNK